MAQYETAASLMRMVAKICMDYNVHCEVRLAGLKLSCFDKSGRVNETVVTWEELTSASAPDVIMIMHLGVLGKFGLVKGQE